MATRVETSRSGVVYRAAESRSVPNLDLLTFLFDSPHCSAHDDTLLHVSAAEPSIFVTKAQARNIVETTAHVFRNKFGIGAESYGKDVISCIATGHHLIPTIFYAAIAARGVFSAASAASTPSDLARQIKQGESKLLICTKDVKDIALDAAKQARLPENRVLVVGEASKMELFEARTGNPIEVGPQKLKWPRITDQRELEQSLACLIYSSGTTGLPKGVRLSHMNLVAEAFTALEPLKEFNRVNRPHFKYRTIGHLPIAHIAGIQGYLVNPFYMGGPVYWMPRFDFLKFLEYNQRFKVTHFFSVPPIYLLIAKSPEVKNHFDTLEVAISGAAPLGKEIQQAASTKLGKGKTIISQTWGLSETTGSITLLPNGWTDTTGSVSCLMANCSARLIDDQDKDVPEGSPGEIIVKGPIVTKGYHNNDKANKEAFIDGWFRTGDIGQFQNGMFYVVDRKKELIKYKGLQVAPAELEALLLSHPDIADAAVIGIETDDGNEVPRAYVVADKNKITEPQIEAFVSERVSNHKKLRGGVVYLEAIPKSASGKILRKDLREMAKKEGRSKL